jgi:hypothetical protein
MPWQPQGLPYGSVETCSLIDFGVNWHCILSMPLNSAVQPRITHIFSIAYNGFGTHLLGERLSRRPSDNSLILLRVLRDLRGEMLFLG